MTPQETVFVEAHARLHFGVLDLRSSTERWFGGLGAAAPAPTVLVSAAAADTLEVHGDDEVRAAAFARRFLTHYGIDRGARIRVHRALPPHSGLGSGTQLALAVARALAELLGIEAPVTDLGHAVDRGKRSAVGMWTFAGPGLVVEGGRRREGTVCGPLVARLAFPATWRCVVAVPNGTSGLSGVDEVAAFDRLPPPRAGEPERVAHLVLMSLLPAVADGDIAGFGAALEEIQRITGEWFAPVQGGVFAPGPSEELIRRMREAGATGVGQSSWGPAVYGVVEGDDQATRVADRLRLVQTPAIDIFSGPFPATGARIWHS